MTSKRSQTSNFIALVVIMLSLFVSGVSCDNISAINSNLGSTDAGIGDVPTVEGGAILDEGNLNDQGTAMSSDEVVSTGTAESPPLTGLEVQWSMTYGGTGGDCANSIEESMNGGYIVAGYTDSFGSGETDCWLVKIDSQGVLEWSNFYGETKNEFGYSVLQSDDGGFIVAGEKRFYNRLDDINLTSSYKYDFWILKVDSKGVEQWEKNYGGDDYDRANEIGLTDDGGYIVAGHTQSYGAEYKPEPHAKKDLWIMKLDSLGGLEWQQFYGAPGGSDGATSVQQTADGGFIVGGFTSSYGAGSYDCWVLKLDGLGEKEWTKTFGGAKRDWANSIRQTSDGGYILAGETASFGAGNVDYFIVKMNASGGTEWQKTFGGTGFERATSIRETSKGDFIIAGYTGSAGAGNKDFWILKLDHQGNVLWSTPMGGASCDSASAIRTTSDGGYVVTGNTSSFGAGAIDFWVVKFKETIISN